jgi:hypothetical protein
LYISHIHNYWKVSTAFGLGEVAQGAGPASGTAGRDQGGVTATHYSGADLLHLAKLLGGILTIVEKAHC